MRGASGSKGTTGSKGATGSIGPTGLTGKRGAAGAEGPPGNIPPPQTALTGLHEQIGNIYNELAIQIKRMAQVQAELDDVRAKLKYFTGDMN